MSVYKVPQDVEADDKLLGPFTPRQLVYLGIVAMAIAIAYGLGKLLLPLFIIPLPIIILFGALALPLRKDQPMEAYLAAIVSFFLKPHRRLWDPDGIDSIIEITAPKSTEVQLTKDLSEGEARQRFKYLAQIVDSQGWSIRGTGMQNPNNSMISDEYYSAQQVEDVMDENNTIAITFNQKLDQSSAVRHQQALNIISKTQTTNNITPAQPNIITEPEPIISSELNYNPYPEDMRQTVIKPINKTTSSEIKAVTPASKPITSTSEKPLSAGIINLANNSSLSIETIAREANRINKQDLEKEVFVSLR